MEVNLNNLSVDSAGRVSVSGVSSGIDSKKMVDAIIAARRIPIDRLDAQVEINTAKVEALKELRTLAGALKDSLNNLRGAVSVGGASDAFKTKQAFTSTSRSDGVMPATAANLLGVSVTNAATLGAREIEVLRVAKAHKIGTAAFTSLSADLGTARGTGAGSVAGTFTVNAKTISVGATDTLLDLRDRINNANTGSSPSGVSASVVSVSTTEHYLVLTNDKTGIATAIGGETGAVLSELGISADGGTTFTNELQKPQTARIKADGLLDPNRYESEIVSSRTAALSTLATGATYPGSFQIVGTGTATINYTATTTLDDLVTLVNAQTATTGVTATLLADGNGHRLVMTSAAASFSLTDSGGLMARLGVDNKQVIERDSNTVADLYSGVTLSLYGGEENTKIKIDVDRNLSSIKSQVIAFRNAYNMLKAKLNEHELTDPRSGTRTDETGVLFGTRTVKDVGSQLAALVGGGVAGVDTNFSVLAQIGLTFVNNATLADPLLKSTLTLNEPKFDEALLKNPESVRRLFSFDFTSSDSRFVLLGFAGTTKYASAGYTLNIGNVGPAQQSSRVVTSTAALLNDAVNSVGATTSGSFQINGTPIAYNVAVDTIDSLAAAIAAAGISGVSASVSSAKLQITSTANPLVVSGDTGNLVAALTLSTNSYLVGRANIGGAAAGTDDGSATVSGNTITATSATSAQGLKVMYTGNADASGIAANFTVGFGAQIYFALDSMLTTGTGIVDADISALDTETKTAKTRISDMDARLEIQRQTLTDRFVAMEAALSKLNSLLESVKNISDAMNRRN